MNYIYIHMSLDFEIYDFLIIGFLKDWSNLFNSLQIFEISKI